MEVHVERAFLSQLETDRSIGLAALERMGDALRQRRALAAVVCAIEVVRAAGSISRVFWPYPYNGKDPAKVAKAQAAAARAAHLRTVLGVTDASAFKSLEMRHNIEHLDERLDAWAAEASGVMASYNVAPIAQLLAMVPSENDIIFCLDPEALTLHFRGDRFDLNAIRMGFAELRASADERELEQQMIMFRAFKQSVGSPATPEQEAAERALQARSLAERRTRR